MRARVEIPDLWTISSLGEILTRSSKRIDPIQYPEKTFFYVGLENISGDSGQLVNVPAVKGRSIKSSKFVFESGDILYGKLRPYLNKVCLADQDGVCSSDIWVLKPSAIVLAEYVYYYLRSESVLKHATQLAHGANLPRLSADLFDSFPIPLPPLSEQQEIVEMLREAGMLRQIRQQVNQRVQNLLPSLFFSIFGHIGIDTHFNQVKLDSIAEVVSGVTKGRKLDKKLTINVPYLRVANVQDGFLDLSEISYIEVLPADVQKYAIKNGDILLTEGGDFDKLGRGTIWDRDDFPNMIHQNHIFRVRPNKSQLNSIYFSSYIQSPFAKQYFLRSAKQTTNLASINIGQLKNLPVTLPPLDLQEEFAEKTQAIKELIANQTMSEQRLDGLFNSIITRAFTGNLTNKFRNDRYAQLEKETNERDLNLGLTRQKRTILNLEDDEHRNRLGRNISRRLPTTLTELLEIATDEKSITQQSFSALVQMVEEVAPALPDKEDRLFNLIDPLLQNVQHGLRQRFVESIEAITQRILPFYQQDLDTKALLEMLLRSAKNIGALTPHAPQAARTIRIHETQANRLDDRLQKLLRAIEQRPPYFRAFDLVHDSIGVAEATAGLRILESLGLIRRVVWETDLDAVFRLVDPASSDDAMHRDSEGR